MISFDKRQLRRSFERAAATYDAHAVLQFEIADRMLSRLDMIKVSPKLMLDVGCGTGYCTRLLNKRYRRSTVIGIDIAPGMLARARHSARPGWGRRQVFACGDAEALPLASQSVELVVSNLALQWCDPASVFTEFARVLKPGGLLMFTSFGPDTLKELRQAWGEADSGVHVHDFIDMHDLGDALIGTGFAEPVMDVEHFTLTYPGVRHLLQDLKYIGAHNIARDRNPGLTGKTHFARFEAAYDSMRQQGLIPASYEAVYGHAWKPVTGHRQPPGPGSQSIPFPGPRRPV